MTRAASATLLMASGVLLTGIGASDAQAGKDSAPVMGSAPAQCNG
jgi:hypothetical protein